MIYLINRNKVFYKLIIACFFVFSLACKKDTQKTIQSTEGVSGDIKDYCLFKIGSWWVYVDSLTNNVDSVYVTSSYNGIDTITQSDNLGYTGNFEFFNVAVYSTYYQKSTVISANYAEWEVQNAKNIPRTHLTNSSLPSGQNQTLFFFLNGYLNNNILYNIDSGQENYIGKTNFSNQTLSISDALLFINSHNDLEYKHQNYYVFAKHVGLIQNKVIQGGSDSAQYQVNWKLKSYYINE